MVHPEFVIYYIQKDNTKAETITFHTLNNSNSYLHFDKLPQSGVYFIHFPHCISDVSELKRLWFIFKYAFLYMSIRGFQSLSLFPSAVWVILQLGKTASLLSFVFLFFIPPPPNSLLHAA